MDFFDLLIKNTSKAIDFNQKEIKIRLKSRSTIQFCHWYSNQTKIDNPIWTAWNPNHQLFDSGSLLA